MKDEIRSLSPSAIWNHFADLNAVPRPSKNEGRVIAFMLRFGEQLNLDTTVDDAGNVIIRKPATAGMEDRPAVVIQSHLDMVHQKNSDTVFDFSRQGIEMYVDGDWVRARGTTLGADNGIGVAAIMSLLSSADIPHPPLEALFTIDEETGMTGALSLQGGMLTGKTLLNLDTENDRELTIGCAGGLDVTAAGTYTQASGRDDAAFRLMVKGLTGGHSGGDIHLGRGNANKLLNRVLLRLIDKYHIRISEIDGGSLRNAIPREAFAIATVNSATLIELRTELDRLGTIIKEEYKITDPNLELTLEEAPLPALVADDVFTGTLLRAIYACPNGIYRMSPEIAGLVQSSNNLARVIVKGGSYSLQCLTRSSVDSEKDDLKMAITSAFELMGATLAYTSGYPGWRPDPNANIVLLMSSLYRKMFAEEPHVNAVHAGLECGILGTNYPDMEMISFGPNIEGAHSPDERVQISSVQKFWSYLLETLKNI